MSGAPGVVLVPFAHPAHSSAPPKTLTPKAAGGQSSGQRLTERIGGRVTVAHRVIAALEERVEIGQRETVG